MLYYLVVIASSSISLFVLNGENLSEGERKPGPGWGLFQVDVSGIQGLKGEGREDGGTHRRDAT